MNDVIKRALQKAGLSLVLEPLSEIEEIGHALMVKQSSRLVVAGVWFGIARVLLLLLGYT